MNPIDYFLNRVSTYRLVRNGLWVLAGFAFLGTFFGWVPYTPIDLIVSILILVFTAHATNALCALFTRATPAPEAATITALILFFILTPLQSSSDALFFIIAAALAILSKYVLSIGTKTIFNPAALAALVLSIAGSGLVSWWVGTPILLPPVLLIGFFVVRKTRQTAPFTLFVCAVLVVVVARGLMLGTGAVATVSSILFTSPLVFFGAFMLTDPQTMPAAEGKRSVYGLFVGILYGVCSLVTIPAAMLFASPELALLLGNCYASLFDSKKRISLAFYKSAKLSKDTYECSFVPTKNVRFEPGQYVEVTVPHRSADARGIRRYFTIASSPRDHFVRFLTTIPVESSTFKDALLALKKDQIISAIGAYGNFTLPRDPGEKIFAIAHGVGIAPFMSMFRDLSARHERRDIVLVYAALTPLDLVYQEEIDTLKDSIGLSVIYLPVDFSELSGWEGLSGQVRAELIEKEIRDFRKRRWYVAGPDLFVQKYGEVAESLGIRKSLLRTQKFSGF